MDRKRGGPAAGFGPMLRARRLAAGLTQDRLADLAGLSVAAVRDLEQGRRRRPRPSSLARLTSALGLDASQAWELAAAARTIASSVAASERPAQSSVPAHGLWVQVLGPLAAWRDGTPIRLGTPKQRALLGLLALHPNVAVHRESLIDAVWGQAPPATACNLDAPIERLVMRHRDQIAACPDAGSGRQRGLGGTGGGSRALSWLSCWRRLQVRWDRDSGRWVAFVLVACAVVGWNRLGPYAGW